MEREADNRTVLLGGDLNVRDEDISAVGKPEQLVDLWEWTGSRRDARYTWDTMRNSNAARYTGKGMARLRFDRFVLRQPTVPQIVPIYFELAGLERVPNSQRFVSDHWAILAHFYLATGTGDGVVAS